MARSRPKTRRHPRSNPRGILRISASGYGFVHTAEGEYFIPSPKMSGAFDGDMVELAPLSVNHQHKQAYKEHSRRGEKPSARVIRVLDRAHETLIGRYEVAEPFGVVIPEDHRIPYDIFTMRADNPHIEDGDIVRVRMTEYPTRKTAATGIIEEVIGKGDSETLAIDVIIARHKLEITFSEASLEQAASVALDVDDALAEGYIDNRDRVVFTIDPEDARDFDDAISLDKVDGLWRLGVHIADVSRYVEWGSSIDLDARRRATSVYLVDRVIPMLPEKLSNDICSLKPRETRTVMTVDLFLDKNSCLKKYEIYPSLINSSARFSYEEVQDILENNYRMNPNELSTSSQEAKGEQKAKQQDATRQGKNGYDLDSQEKAEADFRIITGINARESLFEERFRHLHRIAKDLAWQRERAGGIDFATTEARVKLDEEGVPLEIVLRKKTDATEIIEEAMILANTTVARYLHERSFPCIYRVHEAPSPDTLADLVAVFQEFDYLKVVSKAEIIAGDPSALQQILELSKGKPEEELVSSLLLRAMKRAQYKPECDPHYGLAREAYAHFTSPIRRYPDLVVHRMLRAQLGKKPESFESQVNSLTWLSEHSSKMERLAETASRESQEYKMVEYLQHDVGCAFKGVIAGVTNYGFFVRLENTAEGLVSVNQLGDEYFAFDPKRHTLTGEESGVCYRLGQSISVVLEAADLYLGRLDFKLMQE